MTVFTTNAPDVGRRRHPSDRAEYRLYFTLLFLVTLPIALLTWPLSLVGLARTQEHGPLDAAWRQARTITPMIFRG